MANYEIKDVPADKVENKKTILLQDGATEVDVIKQDDGKFTLIAHYPD
ncbi:MAG: hypothetical protein ACI88A_002759 [Paraglaciecola sp.]|jgi:hypothetical protein